MREVERDEVLRGMVRFIEPVPDIATLLPQIDVLVMPSLWEACPLLPMEAMALGVPVVGSDAIGLREVLRDTPSLTPVAGNVSALAAALQEAIDARTKRPAQAYVLQLRERFDNNSGAKSLRRVYDTIAP